VQQQHGNAAAITPTLRHPQQDGSDVAFLLGAVGRLWVAGVTLDSARFHAAGHRRRVPLPTYPFERQRYWIDPDPSQARGAPTMALRKSPDIGEWFYAPSWARSAPPSPTATGDPPTWLVFTDDSSLAAATVLRLRSSGHVVVEVVAAERFAMLGNHRYSVNPAVRTDFDALASELRNRAALPRRVLHLWALSPGPRPASLARRVARDPLRKYQSALRLHYFSLIFFAQAFAADADALRLVCVSSHMQSVPGDAEVHPEKAVLLGACKVIPREYPQVACVSIDVALPSTPIEGQRLAERLFRELDGDGLDGEVALRGTDRWVRRFDAVRIDAVAPRPWLRKGGVYLVTGGLGGIGLRVADHLARSGDVKLVLLGRTPLPPEEQFADWLVSHAPDDETSRKILAVRALRAHGAQVMTVAADVTDLHAMRTALAGVRTRFGAVHGVFHAAGVLKDELIALRAPSAESAVLDSKMKGALVLDALLAREPLDIFVLFSSVSSILGLSGQADYTAANAFLDAFAHAHSTRGPGRTVSIDWNAWQDVGMLAARSQPPADEQAAQTRGGVGQTCHPALQVVVSDHLDATLFRTSFRRDGSWMLGEHVVRGGDAVLPGTGFLEIARAAVEHRSESRPVELRDVVFLAPFVVSQDGERSLHVRMERGGDGEFSCYAESEKEPLVVGKASYVDAPVARPADLDSIRARCTARGDVENGQLVQHFMDFGPRWGNVQHIDLGDREALVSLELPAAFGGDLDAYRLHPALFDLATGSAQALIPGFDARATFHVPFSYERVLIRRALTPRLFSHVRLRERGAKDSVVFDATLYDESGEEIVSVEGFTMRKALPGLIRSAQDRLSGVESARRAKPRPETATEAALHEGMTPVEGVEALDRVLALEFSPQVVVCTVPLQLWLDQLAAEARGSGSGPIDNQVGPVFTRPSIGATFAAPRNAVERELAAMWSGLLGVAEVGVHDDFFELGGYSLTAVRLFARIKKTFGVELPLDTLFRAPTIATCAELLARDLDLDTGARAFVPHEASNGARMPKVLTPSAAAQNVWSPLVAIQATGSKPPFFCVHGAGGHVLILRDLARRLGDDQPFFGLQPQGIDGKLPPLRSIEAMAAQYLEAICQVQPHGPYLLSGYSGGGVIALEIARRLQDRGEEVAQLVFLDTFCPVRPPQPKEATAARPSRVVGLMFRAPAVIRNIWNRVRVFEHTRRGTALPEDLQNFAFGDLQARMMKRVKASYLAAERNYQPAVYEGPATLLQAAEVDPQFAWLAADRGWTPFMAGGLDVRTVPGNHATLVLEPNVQVLASELRAVLDRAVRRSKERAA
jgi:thioesterase domain-containing protein/NAD(P)-dependent dehydrogenase (short-subunit alcohol dehydrogenase family)/acyl carrier protein